MFRFLSCGNCEGKGAILFRSPLDPGGIIDLDYRDGTRKQYIVHAAGNVVVKCQLCTGTGRKHWLTWQWWRSKIVKPEPWYI